MRVFVILVCGVWKVNRIKTRKFIDDIVSDRGITKTDEEKEKMVETLMFNDDDMKSVMDHLESIPKPKPGENELLDHYNEKDEKGNLKHDLWADLKSMNTNDKGECLCSMCGKVFKYDDTDVNVCKECMEDNF